MQDHICDKKPLGCQEREAESQKEIEWKREREEREELYVNVLNEEIIYKEEESNYIKYGIL